MKSYDKSKIKNYVISFENGDFIYNYSCYFENDKVSKIIDFLRDLSNEITKRNFVTIKFNCVVNDFEFSHQILFNFIYADYVENAPDNTNDENDTLFNNCNVDFYQDMRFSLFSSVREYLLQIWDKWFLKDLKKYNAKEDKKPFDNLNYDDCDFIIYQKLSGDNLDGFIAQNTEL